MGGIPCRGPDRAPSTPAQRCDNIHLPTWTSPTALLPSTSAAVGSPTTRIARIGHRHYETVPSCYTLSRHPSLSSWY
jgi:hypothetical protein